MKLGFSTLGCPGMTIEQIIDLAVQNQMDSVELMGGAHGHIAPERGDHYNLGVKNLCDANGIVISNLTSYTFFSMADKTIRLQNAQTLIDYCKLAVQVGAPYVRAFIGMPDAERPEEDICANAAEALCLAAQAIEELPVHILIETHDWVQKSSRLKRILDDCPPAIEVLWDFAVPFAAGEDLAYTFGLFKNKIRHVHVKDKVLKPGGGEVPCAPGEGNIPIAEAVSLLKSIDYQGFLSFEWERAWNLALTPMEGLLPVFRTLLRSIIE